MKSTQLILFGSLAVLTAWPVSSLAEQIYHWVDANGVQHFSQTAPDSGSKDVRTLDVDGSQPASYDPEEDRYNVAAQTAATQAVRDRLAENRKEQQERRPVNPEPQVIYYPEPNYSYGNGILYPPDYPRPRPPNRPPGKPDHPSKPEPEPYSKPFRPPNR